MLDDAVTGRNIEDRHNKTEPEINSPLHDGNNVQQNVDSQSYGEQSVTDDSDNVQHDRNKEISKAK